MPDLNNVSLFDVLSVPTQERNGIGDFVQQNAVPDNVPDPSDFNEEIIFHPDKIEHQEEEEEPYTEEDARNEANKIIDMIDFANTLTLNPIGGYRIKKKYGGAKVVKAAQIAHSKKITGQKLTEKEEQQSAVMIAYRADIESISEKIPLSERQREIMLRAFIPMCRDRKIRVNSDFAAIVAVLGIEMSKIMAIIQL